MCKSEEYNMNIFCRNYMRYTYLHNTYQVDTGIRVIINIITTLYATRSCHKNYIESVFLYIIYNLVGIVYIR